MDNTPQAVARALRRAGQFLMTELRRAERANVQTVMRSAQDYSFGPYSSPELAAMKHPYAKRRRKGQARLDPGVINVQTGEFLFGWEDEGPEERGDTIFSQVFNETPHAEYLAKGALFMVALPLPEKVKDATEVRVDDRRRRAVVKAFERAFR